MPEKKIENTLGDAPIQPELHEIMNSLGSSIDKIFNGEGERMNGFILMVFPFGDNPHNRANYISNAQRDDVVVMLKEQIKRFEGQPEVKGNA